MCRIPILPLPHFISEVQNIHLMFSFQTRQAKLFCWTLFSPLKQSMDITLCCVHTRTRSYSGYDFMYATDWSCAYIYETKAQLPFTIFLFYNLLVLWPATECISIALHFALFQMRYS